MTKNNIKIGTRGSQLALWQANFVKGLLEKVADDIKVEIVPIKTSGDIILDVSLARLEGKAFFTKEIEDALLDGRVDIAVHSGKDVPTELPTGLALGGFLKRHCPNDAWISASQKSFAKLPKGAVVGTSSLRRRAFIAHLRPDLSIVDLRGNVDTRLRKLKEGQFDAVVLAAAGLERLGLLSEITELLPTDLFPPAVSQGAVAVEIRTNEDFTKRLVAKIVDEDTTHSASAERALLAALEGGCQVPLGALAKMTADGALHLFASLIDPDGNRRINASASGPKSAPEALGLRVARELKDKGGDEILEIINRLRGEVNIPLSVKSDSERKGDA
jgi:hydroxymethylbilane synthase